MDVGSVVPGIGGKEMQVNGQEQCNDCGSNRNETLQKLDKFRWRIRCLECRSVWIKDNTPHGYYADPTTKKGAAGRPLKGCNLSKYGLNARERALMQQLT